MVGAVRQRLSHLDPKGRVLRCLRKPASNYHVVGMEQAVQHISEGIRDALQEGNTGGNRDQLAGIDTPEDWKIMADGLKQGLKS